jgi:flagellar L-ring protein precursor FlgH
MKPALLTSALLLALVVPAAADSIYPIEKSRNMFSDRKAHAIGDVVTVLVTENTIISQDADSKLGRSTSATAGGGTGGFFHMLKLIPKATLTGSTKQEGSGSTTRTTKVISTVACKVVNITENGMLVIRGERFVRTNNDTQTVSLNGTVRPEDVDPDNTVASGSVADARIEISGKGPISRHIKQGLLTRIFEFLF